MSFVHFHPSYMTCALWSMTIWYLKCFAWILYNWEWVWILMEKAMAPHSSTFAWKIPWTEEPGRLQSMGSLELDTTERLHFHFSLSCIGEGNGNPLQCSCLENPRDGEAWWAAVYGVAQSWTGLERLSSSSSSSMDSENYQKAESIFLLSSALKVTYFQCVSSLKCVGGKERSWELLF